MKPLLNHSCHVPLVSVIARVCESLLAEELFLDQPRADEATKRVGATSLVVGTASTRTTERLLSDQGSGCLAVCRSYMVSFDAKLYRCYETY